MACFSRCIIIIIITIVIIIIIVIIIHKICSNALRITV